MSTDKGDRFDQIISRLYNEMGSRIERTAVAMRNEKVPGQEKVPEHAQLQQYIMMRDNPQAWSALMGEKGIKSATKYYKAGEKLLDRYTKKAYKRTDMGTGEEPPKRPMSTAFMQALTSQLQQMQQSARPDLAQAQQQQAPPDQMQQQMPPPEGMM